jgi:hypothetical protein|tara:strand:+ start:54 stop:221 length:168 start_codon:yes stop_codon:yes gene_type:complete
MKTLEQILVERINKLENDLDTVRTDLAHEVEQAEFKLAAADQAKKEAIEYANKSN